MNWHNVLVLRIVIRDMPKRALLVFGESKDSRSHRWEPARKVAPILTEDRRGQARFVQLHDGSRRISAHKASPRPSAAIL